MSPGLKLPTQSQMANSNLKVPDLKVCVQNVKFIVFHMNFRKFPNFRTFPEKLLKCIKVVCTEKFGMAIFGHSELLPTIFPKKMGKNSEWPKIAIPNFL